MAEHYKNLYHLDRNYLNEPRKLGDILLYQLGRMYCSDDTVIYRHTQFDCIELTLVTGGRGTVLTNDIATNVSNGDIYVSFSGDVHEIISDSIDPLKYDFLAVDTKDPQLHSSLERIMIEFHDEKCRVIHSDEVFELVARALAEESSDGEHNSKLMEAMLNEIIIYFIRSFGGMSSVQKNSPNNAEIFCYSLMNYIDSHIYSMKNLSELSDFTNYSYNYISNLYKEVTSDTLMNYYRKKRLETAKLLLENESLSVTRIAQLLNYSSVYTFSRAFKEYYGVSPTDMRMLK